MSDSVRIIALSDVHDEWDRIAIPGTEFDVLVLAGDLHDDRPSELLHARQVIRALPHHVKIAVFGNHDTAGIERPDLYPMCRVLVDELLEVDGLIFYGAPWDSPSSRFGWEFRIPGGERDGDDRMDVLVTHEPPYRIRDWGKGGSKYGVRLGNRDLLMAVERAKPRLHIYGHAHSGFGHQKIGETVFVNVAICDEQYAALNEATTIDISDSEIVVTQNGSGTRYAR
jgi:Icc-related predicted phosphoesterase